MLCFLGMRVQQPIHNKKKYKQCLQEIKHYLSLKKVQRKIQIMENQYLITVVNQNYTFSLVKNPCFLHSCSYNMPLFQSQDFQFLQICYESLMIIEEAFPLGFKIELITDEQSPEISLFQERKKQELNRRINNNIRALAQSDIQLDQQDIENTIFLINHSYWRKNKQLALKMLASKLNPSNCIDLSQQFLQYVDKLQQQPQLRKLAIDLSNKIKKFQSQYLKNNQNAMKMSNISNQTVQKYGENMKIQPLIFQLKESYNLERICALLGNILSTQQQKQIFSKIQTSINVITNKFLSNQFQEAHKYSSDFVQLLRQYWNKRGKKWQQTIRASVEMKVRELNATSRGNVNKSRLITSRNAT